MRRTVSNLIVIVSQLLIVGLFFVTVFNSDIKLEKHVSTIHNENLNKIATSVSLLFEEEISKVSLIDCSVSKVSSKLAQTSRLNLKLLQRFK